MTTILHVEDDLTLAEAVQASFEGFGFRGEYLIATDVGEARRIIADLVDHPTIDLVILDLRLGDRTGLDVLRSLRGNPARAHVPALVLSYGRDREEVNQAYALGANSFVSKGTRGRPLSAIVRALFQHWLEDAVLPRPTRQQRTHAWLSSAVAIQRRFAEKYLAIAEHLGAESEEADFWIELALRQGNLANLLAFLRSQLGARELPADLLDNAEKVRAGNLQILDELDRSPVQTRQDVMEMILAIVDNVDGESFARVTSCLFPAAPAVMPTLLEIAAETLDTLATWVDTNATDPRLLERTERLHRNAASIRGASKPGPFGAELGPQHP